jgi:GNAT superfamily N-acetyltransferase
MSSKLWPRPSVQLDRKTRANLTEDLFRSDQIYFAAGAVQTPFPGGTLLSVPGLEHVPAGCVILPREPITATEEFVAEASIRARSTGASLLRFYTRAVDANVQDKLLAAGLHASPEYAFVRSAAEGQREPPRRPTLPLEIRPVRSEVDWEAKAGLAASMVLSPDGKACVSADWTNLERRKCASGYMDMWLVEVDGVACGAFGLAGAGRLLRLKNLVVHPSVRRIGIGAAIICFALEQARARSFPWVGVYGLPGHAGSALYGRAEFQFIGEQIEWTRRIATERVKSRMRPENASC